MLAGVADDLRRGVEAHRLAVQQGAGKNRWVVALHPGRGIDQVGKAGGAALGEAIAAEALDLLEHPLGEGPLVAAPDHALDQPFLVAGDATRQLEGRHGPAQLVGLLRGEAGGDARHRGGSAALPMQLSLPTSTHPKDHRGRTNFSATYGYLTRPVRSSPATGQEARVMSDRIEGTAAAAVGAHSKDAMESPNGSRTSSEGSSGSATVDRGSSGAGAADNLEEAASKVSGATATLANDATETAGRAATAAREGVSRAGEQVYRQGAQAGEYVGGLVKGDPLVALLGAGVLGFALGLLVGRR